MDAIIPFADQVSLDGAYRTRLTRLDGIVFHVAVSNADVPTYAPGTKAHGYVRKDGSLVQHLDMRVRSGACREGNPRLWTFETQGGLSVGDRQLGTWTEEQVATMVKLCVLAADEGVPVRLMASSASSERGIGWHRLGIDGNFPALPSILAGRTQRGGGERWSYSFGKTCPLDGRIGQMPTILNLTQSQLAIPQEEYDMPIIYLAVNVQPYGVLSDGGRFAALTTAEETRNLILAGVKQVWVEQRTLNALIDESRRNS